MLPFFDNSKGSNLAYNVGPNVQSHDIEFYKYPCPFDEHPSFFLYSNTPTFNLKIVDIGSNIETVIPSINIKHDCFFLDNKYVLIFGTKAVECYRFYCDSAYKFIFNNYESEVFYPVKNIDNYTRFELSNKFDVSGIPFQANFKSIFWLDLPILKFKPKLYQESEVVGGKKVTTKTIISDLYENTLGSIPKFLNDVLYLMYICDNIKVVSNQKEYIFTNNDISISTEEDDYYGYNTSISFELKKMSSNCEKHDYKRVNNNYTPYICIEPNPIISIDVDCEVSENYYATVLILY